MTAFVVESSLTSDDGGGGVLAVLRDFAIEGGGSRDPSPPHDPTINGWTAGVYAAGARVFTGSFEYIDPNGPPTPVPAPHAEPRYYLEAIVGGNTGATEPANPGSRDTDDPAFPEVGIGHDVVDNDITWRCRVHSGIYAKVQCYIERVRIHFFANAGVTYDADHSYYYPAGGGIANAGGASRCSISACAVGTAVRGDDTNDSAFTELTISDAGYDLYGQNDATPVNGGVGIWHETKTGARFIACTVDTCSLGRSVYVRNFAQSSAATFVGLHEEGATYPNHLGAGLFVGGYLVDGFTANSEATVLIQSNLKNFQTRGTPTYLAGITTNLVIPGLEDPVSPNNGVLAAGSSDLNGRWQIVYGVPYGVTAVAGVWGINWSSEPAFFGWTNNFAVDAFANLLGPSQAWLPRGAFHGNDGGYPSWFEFANEVDVGSAQTSTLFRGGMRLVGDRIRTKEALVEPGLVDATFGAPAERIVLTAGSDAGAWPGGTVVGLDAVDIISAQTYRPDATLYPGQQHKVFRCVTSGATGGAEPDPTAVALGGTLPDNVAVWRYDDNAPVLGSTVLGATLTASSDNASAEHLSDPYGVELVLPDACAFALSVTILASRTAGGAALAQRDVWEVLATTTGGALTLGTPDLLTTSNAIGSGGSGWSATLSAAAGRTFRITAQGALGETVEFKARIEFTTLAGA